MLRRRATAIAVGQEKAFLQDGVVLRRPKVSHEIRIRVRTEFPPAGEQRRKHSIEPGVVLPGIEDLDRGRQHDATRGGRFLEWRSQEKGVPRRVRRQERH